jgi:hypothetical protein
MFRATSAHHQEDQIVSIHHLVLYTVVGGCLVCQSTGTQDNHPLDCIIPDDVLTQFDPPDDEHLLLETCTGVK